MYYYSKSKILDSYIVNYNGIPVCYGEVAYFLNVDFEGLKQNLKSEFNVDPEENLFIYINTEEDAKKVIDYFNDLLIIKKLINIG